MDNYDMFCNRLILMGGNRMNKKKRYALAMLSATSLVYASGLSQGVYAIHKQQL